MDQIADRLDPPQKRRTALPAAAAPAAAAVMAPALPGYCKRPRRLPGAGRGLWEIDVRPRLLGRDCSWGPRQSGFRGFGTEKRPKLQLEVYQEEEELKSAPPTGLIPSAKQDAVLRVSIPSDYRGGFSFEGDACSAVLRDIKFSGEIDLELSACDLQGSGLQGTEISISASTATISLSGLRGKLDLEQSLGDTSLTFAEVAGDIEVENSLGNVDLYFPPNSPIQINSASSLGEIHRNLQHSGSGQAFGLFTRWRSLLYGFRKPK